MEAGLQLKGGGRQYEDGGYPSTQAMHLGRGRRLLQDQPLSPTNNLSACVAAA